MADLHHLPEPPLPEGWEPSSMFAGCVVRYVSRIPGWAPETIRANPFAEGAIHLLVVEGEGKERMGRPGHGVVLGPFRSRREAIAAVERAYCGCRVRGVQGG